MKWGGVNRCVYSMCMFTMYIHVCIYCPLGVKDFIYQLTKPPSLPPLPLGLGTLTTLQQYGELSGASHTHSWSSEGVPADLPLPPIGQEDMEDGLSRKVEWIMELVSMASHELLISVPSSLPPPPLRLPPTTHYCPLHKWLEMKQLCKCICHVLMTNLCVFCT